jgi:hypothetical protein
MEMSPDTSEDPSELHPDGWFAPECDHITLPSTLAPGKIERLSLTSIAVIKAELCKGQVMDALEGLCLALSEKSLCFRTEVQNTDSQWTTYQAWDNVHKLDTEARKCQTIYCHARIALQHLSCDPECLATLQDITKDNLKVTGDITDKQQFGQQSDTLR